METVEVNAEYYKQLRSESRAYPWVLMFMAISCLFMGVWTGVVMSEGVTYNVCAGVGEVTYHSWAYKSDMKMKCEVKK